ncbi:unnamed protein product [Sphagnum troendelagicum]|uniref:Uncharacterized protein n=1 Tax=Sphagnum troendelagicum TaxID=128251 RepID=A0ABP0UBT5_9BRYO
MGKLEREAKQATAGIREAGVAMVDGEGLTNKALLQKRKRRRRDLSRLSSFASDRFSGGSKPRVATGFLFAARDAYRKHPVINNKLRRATPELGIALAAFDVYLFVKGMTSKLASSPAKKESHH